MRLSGRPFDLRCCNHTGTRSAEALTGPLTHFVSFDYTTCVVFHISISHHAFFVSAFHPPPLFQPRSQHTECIFSPVPETQSLQSHGPAVRTLLSPRCD